MMECDDGGGEATGGAGSGSGAGSSAALASSLPSSSAVSPPPSGGVGGTFDLEAYISRYDARSETRLQRLLHVAERSTDPGVSGTAYRMAERCMRERGNTRAYRQVFGPAAQSAAAAAATAASAEASGGEGSRETAMRAAESSGGGGGGGGGESSGQPANHSSHSSHSNNHNQNGGHGGGGLDDHHRRENGNRNPPSPPSSSSSVHGIAYDPSWVAATDQAARVQLETLEARLSTAQAHLAKEAIRTAYVNLGDFHRTRGELREALRCHHRSRDYCTTQRQSGRTCLAVIELGVDMGNHAQVSSYVSKAEHTADLLSGEPLVAAKLRVASGLAHLHGGRYGDAARAFASASPELTDQFNSVASAEDVALYGSLLGLAALDRSALSRLILDSPSFKQRLELLPWMRDALRHFGRAEYGPCLGALQAHRVDMEMDIHLADRVPALFRAVRDRCLVQYFVPYSAASLGRMGRTFGLAGGGGGGAGEMEGAVAALVARGDVDARINARDGTLVANAPDRRAESVATVERLGDDVLRETESMILRMSCLENDLVVQSEHQRNFRGGGGGGEFVVGGGGGGGGGVRTRSRGRARYGGGGRVVSGGGGGQYPPARGQGGDAYGEASSSDDDDIDDFPLQDEAAMMDISDSGMNVSPER